MKGDQFFTMGDNSPKSFDGRMWCNRTERYARDAQLRFTFDPTREHYVTRDLLIGKAIFIYWPHGWETPWSIPLEFKTPFSQGPPSLRIPFYPNFRRMNFIR